MLGTERRGVGKARMKTSQSFTLKNVVVPAMDPGWGEGAPVIGPEGFSWCVPPVDREASDALYLLAAAQPSPYSI